MEDKRLQGEVWNMVFDHGSEFRSLNSSLYDVVRRWVFLRKVFKPRSAPSLLILEFGFGVHST